MKLKREAHRLFLNVKKESPEWFWVGEDIDEMSVEMNGSFESKKNIRGESSVTDNGYNPSIEATPYYANPEDSIYDFLEDLALNRKSGDECKAEYMEVIVKDTSTEKHTAYKEDCKIEINSYGGNTDGFQIAYTIHPAGGRTEGTVTIADGVPTFTAGETGGV